MTQQPHRKAAVTVFDRVESTNETILAAGESGAPEGTTHLARSQSGGRGRREHTWWSPPRGGLWMSTLLRPHFDRARWGGLSLVAAAATFDAIEALGVRDLRLYWPNDLLVGRRKLGGILGEIRARGERAWVALGIGVNLDLRPETTGSEVPEELRGMVTSLAQEGAPEDLEAMELAGALLDHFWPLYDRFQAGEPVNELVGHRLSHIGGRIEVSDTGLAPVRGVLQGLGPTGELVLRVCEADRKNEPSSPVLPGSGPLSEAGNLSKDGLLSIVSGDVSYEDA